MLRYDHAARMKLFDEELGKRNEEVDCWIAGEEYKLPRSPTMKRDNEI